MWLPHGKQMGRKNRVQHWSCKFGMCQIHTYPFWQVPLLIISVQKALRNPEHKNLFYTMSFKSAFPEKLLKKRRPGKRHHSHTKPHLERRHRGTHSGGPELQQRRRIEMYLRIAHYRTCLKTSCGTGEGNVNGDSELSNLSIWVMTHRSWRRTGSEVKREGGREAGMGRQMLPLGVIIINACKNGKLRMISVLKTWIHHPAFPRSDSIILSRSCEPTKPQFPLLKNGDKSHLPSTFVILIK